MFLKKDTRTSKQKIITMLMYQCIKLKNHIKLVNQDMVKIDKTLTNHQEICLETSV